MMRALIGLVLILVVYANYRSPTPTIDSADGERRITAWSHVLIAPVGALAYLVQRPASRRLRALSSRDRRRCWVLFRIILDVFRYAPEQCESLERVLGAYARLPHLRPRRGPCNPSRMPES